MKRLLKVSSFTALLTFLKLSFGLVLAKVIAVYTGPSGLAVLGQLQSFIGGVTGVANSPVSAAVVKYTSEFEVEGVKACSSWWRASVNLLMGFIIILYPLAYFFSDHLSQLIFNTEEYSQFIIIVVLLLPLSGLGTLINSITNGFQQYKRFVVMGMASVTLSSLFMIYLIMMFQLDGALLAAALQSALIGVLLIFFSLRQPWFKVKYLFGRVSIAYYKGVLGFIAMALTSAIATPVTLITIRGFIAENAGWDVAGQWQAVWKISEVYLMVITVSISTYFLPKISKMNDSSSIRKEILDSLKVITPIVLLLSLFVYASRDLAISILFTEEFEQARDLFAIQLLGNVLKIVGWFFAFPMLSKGAVKWFVSTEVASSLFFISLSYLFINLYGVQGANLAYLINYCFYFFFVYFNFERFAK